MSAPWRGELTVALALTAGEGLPPGVGARGAPQVLGQFGQRRERRRGAILGQGGDSAPLVGWAPGGAEALRPAGDQADLGRGGRLRGEAGPPVVDEQSPAPALAAPHAAGGLGAGAGA